MKRLGLFVAIIVLMLTGCGTARSLGNADLLHISPLTSSDEGADAEVAPEAALPDDFIVCTIRMKGPSVLTVWLDKWGKLPMAGQTLGKRLKDSGALPPDPYAPTNGGCHQLNIFVTRFPDDESEWQSLRYRFEFDAELTVEFSVSRETLTAKTDPEAFEEALALGEERVYAEFAARRREYNTARTLAENARH